MSLKTNLKIAVCGVARNVALDLGKEITRIYRALVDFSEVHFVIVESLSTDGTPEKLRGLSSSFPNFYYTSMEHGERALGIRSVRMAEARNRSLTLQRELVPNVDYVFVVDLDGVNRDLTRDSVQSCFRHDNWDVMTANQPKGYYDILALRHDFWNSKDWGEVYNELRRYMPDIEARRLAVLSKTVKLPKGGPLVPVKSAFGGGAIYKNYVLEGLDYSGLDSLGREVCEHVTINERISNQGGKIFINPDFVNVTHLGRSHSLKKRVIRWAKK